MTRGNAQPRGRYHVGTLAGFKSERVAGFRLECMAGFVGIRSEAHLRRILGAYAAYYNELRTHRSLNKDVPFHREIQRLGVITSQPVLGGLHHKYCRI
jgi:hypothetical protein